MTLPFSHDVLPNAEVCGRFDRILHVSRLGPLSVGFLGPVVGHGNSWRNCLPQSLAQLVVRKSAGRH